METPAGWYDDGSGRQRWWDGQQWTDQYADATAPTQVLPRETNGAPTQVLPRETNGAPTQVFPYQTNMTPDQFSPTTPGADVRTTAPKGWAIAALIVGIVAFLMGLLPVFGLLVGLVGVALGIVALVKKQPKGLGITAIVLAGVAVLVSTGTTLGLASFSSGIKSAVESASPELPSSEGKPVAPAPRQTPEPAKPVEDAGTAQNPLPQPYTAQGLLGGDKYTLTAKISNASANEQVQEWNQFNPQAPAGFKYVIVEMTMTGVDKDGVEPSLATFDISLATAEGNKYDGEFIVFGDGIPSMQDGPKLYPGNSFTGFIAYIVPDSATTFLLHDNGKYVVIS